MSLFEFNFELFGGFRFVWHRARDLLDGCNPLMRFGSHVSGEILRGTLRIVQVS
jgi:hypothetical protein